MQIWTFLIALSLFIPSGLFAEDLADDLLHSNAKSKEILVLKVPAADMITLENGQRIKLLGIESFGPPPVPKIKFDNKGRPIEDKEIEPTIPLEEQAIVFAQELLEGKKVRIEYDVESRDEKGYKTAYVYLSDGRMANLELLRQGFVRLKIRPPNVKHENLLRKAYQEARKEQRGFLSD
jgi:micrococcal nuclease